VDVVAWDRVKHTNHSASPTITWTFLTPFFSNFFLANEVYSGEYLRVVTCPEGPTAWAQHRVEKPMEVPISRTRI
jgi:hypothetical protein